MELCFKEQARFPFMYDFYLFWISMRGYRMTHVICRLYCVKISCFNNFSACKGALSTSERDPEFSDWTPVK